MRVHKVSSVDRRRLKKMYKKCTKPCVPIGASLPKVPLDAMSKMRNQRAGPYKSLQHRVPIGVSRKKDKDSRILLVILSVPFT